MRTELPDRDFQLSLALRNAKRNARSPGLTSTCSYLRLFSDPGRVIRAFQTDVHQVASRPPAAAA
jgi:hypothetical protein